MSFNPVRGDVYLIQHYEIKFVSDLRQVGGFLQVSSTCKTDSHDITEILLKVALNTITLTPPLLPDSWSYGTSQMLQLSVLTSDILQQ